MVITLKLSFCAVVFVQSGELFERFKFKVAVCGWLLFMIYIYILLVMTALTMSNFLMPRFFWAQTRHSKVGFGMTVCTQGQS